MKVLLMYPDCDFDANAAPPPQADGLIQDLELDILFDAMAGDDEFVRPVVKTAVLDYQAEIDVITYRQQILEDCSRQRQTVDALYTTVVDAIDEERKQFHFRGDRASTLLHSATGTMAILLERLRALRRLAEIQGPAFRSPGFIRFFRMLREGLADDYLAETTAHIKEMKFEYGLLVSARLGPGNKGIDFVLRQLPKRRRGLWRQLVYRQPETRAFDVHPRDQAGGRALDELRSRGLGVAASTLGQAADHVLGFFKQLRTELAFYRGAMNLRDALTARDMPVCYPEPAATDRCHLATDGLYDPSLCLTTTAPVTGNDITAEDCALLFVTGANQGGKSTFLRSLGIAQLLMQCGLFVPAERFSANICSGVFTHYKREEDATMTSGKFEEELLRMDDIVPHLEHNGLVLFNESFASTNEREGAEIAAEIIDALVEKGIKVVFVTHFYELALAFTEPERADTLFLKAERDADGSRSHRIVPGKPSTTAYGRDLYARIFVEHKTTELME